MKIIELLINEEDDDAGLDGVALVNMPAHEANFYHFNKVSNEKYVLNEQEIPKVLELFRSFGEDEKELIKQGYKISAVRELNREQFSILSAPNDTSTQDTDEVRFRYKYVGPKDDKNREFCGEMMGLGRVFRIEDIDEMSALNVNNIGPDGYSIFTWRGSYNCRHRWVQLVYTKDGRIINKDNVKRGLIDEDGVPGPDTRTTATIDAGNTPPRVGGAFGVDKKDFPDTAFRVFNSEKRIVVGPAMVPEKLIIRQDARGVYFVYFSADTIRKIQQKYMKDKLLDKNNLEHQDEFVNDVDVVESWIVDDVEKDKQAVFGMEYPVGTWMLVMKVNNDEVWEQVKDGTLNGYSVQGYFMEQAKFNKTTNILDEIKNLLVNYE